MLGMGGGPVHASMCPSVITVLVAKAGRYREWNLILIIMWAGCGATLSAFDSLVAPATYTARIFHGCAV